VLKERLCTLAVKRSDEKGGKKKGRIKRERGSTPFFGMDTLETVADTICGSEQRNETDSATQNQT